MNAKIVLADDHSVVREGLKRILSSEPGLQVIGEASSGEEVLTLLDTAAPDVVLLDISMLGRSGMDVIKDIKLRYPDIKILILSMHPEETFAVRCLKSGASGYLSKESASDELIKAVRKVTEGGIYISSSFAESLAGQLKSDTAKLPHEKLSDREFEVLRLIASGKTVSQIAAEINLSATTVSTYRSRILTKMNMKSNAELTYYVIANNLINVP